MTESNGSPERADHTVRQSAPDASAAVETALKTVRHFVSETTGQAPTDGEIARALKRYFVLKEIMEHIEMERDMEG